MRKKYLVILAVVVVIGVGAFIMRHFHGKANELAGDTVKAESNSFAPKSVTVSGDEKADFTLTSDAYSPSAMTDISNFEESEANAWTGSAVIDEKVFYEGKRSLSLVSADHRGAIAELKANYDLSSMKMIEFMLNASDIDAFEAATIDFGDEGMNNYYRYSITILKNGWNLIQIPKDKFIRYNLSPDFDWSKITDIRIYALARPSSVFLARVDMLRAINDPDNFQTHWRSLKSDTFLTLYGRDNKNILTARGIGATVATIKDVEDVENEIFSASVSPQSSGRSGLFIRGDYTNGYGYYFLISGEKKNTWQILKRNKSGWTPTAEIVQGVMANVSFAKDKKYWLRAEARGDLLVFYFSFDGSTYEKLGEQTDNEFRGGGTGIVVLDGAWSLFDDFRFAK